MLETEKIGLDLEKNTAEDIIAFTARFYGVHLVDMFRRVRKKEFVLPRQVAMYLLREHLKLSFPAIGGFFGSRDHSTIIHAYRKIEKNIKTSEPFKSEVLKLESEIKEGNISLDAIPQKSREVRIREAQSSGFLTIMGGMNSLAIPGETLKRNYKILTSYRSGLSLEEVALEFGVTRERIRQIVKKEIVREAQRTGSEGMVIDISELFKEEKHIHHEALISRRYPERSVVKDKKEKRWSRYYSQCRGCGTVAIKHKRKGYCQDCLGDISGKLREDIMRNKDQKCETCSIDRNVAINKFGRDLYITRDKTTGIRKILCRGCFLRFTGKKLSVSRLTILGRN